MSRFSRTILTRGYELDGRRRASLGTFARYFEVVRWEAIRRPGSPLREVFAEQGRLVMRAQWVEMLTSVVSLEEIEVDVAVAQVGTSSIRFVQSARRNGELVARAEAITVAIDAAKRPKPAPDGVRAMATREPVHTLPAVPERPAAIAFRSRAYVRPSDLDSLEHVNHSRYLDYADDAYVHARAAGVFRDLPDTGYALLVEYERETRLDSELLGERHLLVELWQARADALAFELIDPVDGARVSRGMIEASHAAAATRFVDRGAWV